MSGRNTEAGRPEAGRNEQEPVTFVDKRKVDPETGQVRDGDVVAETLAGTAAAPQPGSVVDEEGNPVDSAPEEDAAPENDELAERTADLQRVTAEYANYRRRVARDKQTDIANAKASVLVELLAVLDDLDRARKHGDLETGPLRSVADKLNAVFTAQGVTAFGAEGDAFDPSVHEAVQHDGDGHNPVVGGVFRQGYNLGDRVLRTAMVAVTDGDTSASAGESSSDEA